MLTCADACVRHITHLTQIRHAATTVGLSPDRHAAFAEREVGLAAFCEQGLNGCVPLGTMLRASEFKQVRDV